MPSLVPMVTRKGGGGSEPRSGESVRVYLVGAHSTGKTTLARWIRDHYGLRLISEVARSVLAEMEAQLPSLRADVELVNRYQSEVFRRQIEAEEQLGGGFVSDRAFCNLAYAAQHSTILSEIATEPALRRYMEHVRSGLVFFVRPHRELLATDGTRENPDWEAVLQIDGMIKLMLEMFAVPYVPMASLSMQERVRLMQRVLTLAGVEPVGEATAGDDPGGIAVPVTDAAQGNGSRATLS